MKLAIALAITFAAPAFADTDAYVQRLIDGQRSLSQTERCRMLIAERDQTGETPAEAVRVYGTHVDDAMQLCEQLIRIDERSAD